MIKEQGKINNLERGKNKITREGKITLRERENNEEAKQRWLQVDLKSITDFSWWLWGTLRATATRCI